jgi:HK97 family phage major capsid protein
METTVSRRQNSKGDNTMAVEAMTRNNAFKNSDEFLAAVRRTTVTEHRDPRLMAAAGSDEQSGASDPYGGFTVPTELVDAGLSASLEHADFIGKLTTKIPMFERIVQIPARTDKTHSTSVAGGLAISRKPETIAATLSRMETEKIVLDASTLMGASFATEELAQSSPVLRPMLEAGYRGESGAKLLQERLFGLGAPGKEFLGISRSAALITIAKEGGQAADTINHTNLRKMRARCWGFDRAIWIACHDTADQLLTAADSNGNLAWSPGDDAVPDRLFGRPLIFSEHARTLGALNDIFLCDWGEYLEGTLEAFTGMESIHVRWSEHERCFKFWTRNAGAPWWRAVLTPTNGANTLSPFVTLAERG